MTTNIRLSAFVREFRSHAPYRTMSANDILATAGIRKNPNSVATPEDIARIREYAARVGVDVSGARSAPTGGAGVKLRTADIREMSVASGVLAEALAEIAAANSKTELAWLQRRYKGYAVSGGRLGRGRINVPGFLEQAGIGRDEREGLLRQISVAAGRRIKELGQGGPTEGADLAMLVAAKGLKTIRGMAAPVAVDDGEDEGPDVPEDLTTPREPPRVPRQLIPVDDSYGEDSSSRYVVGDVPRVRLSIGIGWRR